MKRIVILCTLLMSVCGLSAQTITSGDIQYNLDYVLTQAGNGGISAYEAIDGNVYHVGDVLIIGKPSGGDLFKPYYLYILGLKVLNDGEPYCDRGTITDLYLRKEKNAPGGYAVYANLRTDRITLPVYIDNALSSKEIAGKDEALSKPVTTEQVTSYNHNQSWQMDNEETSNNDMFESRPKRAKLNFNDDGPQRRGYGGIALLEIGYDMMNSGAAIGGSVVNGYHFNSRWYLGGGIGLLNFVGGDCSCIGIPIFAHGQYTFNTSPKFKPYVSLGLGVNIPVYTDSSYDYYGDYYGYYYGDPYDSYNQVGFYINASAGVAIQMNDEKQRLMVGISFPGDCFNGSGIGIQVGYTF